MVPLFEPRQWLQAKLLGSLLSPCFHGRCGLLSEAGPEIEGQCANSTNVVLIQEASFLRTQAPIKKLQKVDQGLGSLRHPQTPPQLTHTLTYTHDINLFDCSSSLLPSLFNFMENIGDCIFKVLEFSGPFQSLWGSQKSIAWYINRVTLL